MNEGVNVAPRIWFGVQLRAKGSNQFVNILEVHHLGFVGASLSCLQGNFRWYGEIRSIANISERKSSKLLIRICLAGLLSSESLRWWKGVDSFTNLKESNPENTFAPGNLWLKLGMHFLREEKISFCPSGDLANKFNGKRGCRSLTSIEEKNRLASFH